MSFQILILVDYRDQLWLKSDYKEQSVNSVLLEKHLVNLGCHVQIQRFADLELGKVDYRGKYVIYQSSEDPDLWYKSFIEDKLLALQLAGAVLVPAFQYFRAHHNKVFMEMLRNLSPLAQLKLPRSWGFGTLEEYSNCQTLPNSPLVFKLSEGAQSKHVRLMRTRKEKARIPVSMTRTFQWYYWLVDKIKPFLKKTYPHYRRKSHHRRKFIVQEFIKDLKGDFKVLVFGQKCFVLERANRNDDFRASGSGRFSFPDKCPVELLDFARRIFLHFKVPFISMDIACHGGEYFVLEFQFVSFGTYTLEKAPHYFKWCSGRWDIVKEKCCLEEEVAAAVVNHLNCAIL